MKSVEDTILNTVKKSEFSLTIDEVAKKVGINRITASKYLAVMEARGLLRRRDVGRAKLFSLRRRR